MEFDYATILKQIKSIIKTASVVRLVKIVLIVFMTATLFALFERRKDIYNSVVESFVVKSTNPMVNEFTIKKRNIVMVEKFLNEFPAANSVVVIHANVRDNLKEVLYASFSKKIKSKTVDTQLPLFTGNAEMNKRTVHLMSGEIYCMASTKNNLGTIVDGIENEIVFSCAIPIPPSYGNFSGWMFIGFERLLTDSELVQLKSEAVRMSNEIKRGT